MKSPPLLRESSPQESKVDAPPRKRSRDGQSSEDGGALGKPKRVREKKESTVVGGVGEPVWSAFCTVLQVYRNIITVNSQYKITGYKNSPVIRTVS